MNAILIMLHLFGLAAAFASSIGNLVVMRLVAASPADAPVLGRVPQMLARVGQTGLALLWLTGLIMVWSIKGGPGELPWEFWVKLLLVIGVTVGVVLTDLTLKQVRAGNQEAAQRLPIYGGATGIMLILVVVFAVLAFH
jgi:hypothetical protein